MDFIWLIQEISKKIWENGFAFFQNAQDKPLAMVWILIILALVATMVMANHDHKDKNDKNKNPPK
jgi:hypothetical protein